MFLSKSVISSLMLIFLLSACGGGDDFNVNGLNGSAGGTTDTEADTTSQDGEAIKIGSGGGNNFTLGVITASQISLTAGSSITVSVNVVNSDNTPYLGSGFITFTSDCVSVGKASFDNESPISRSGTFSAVYTASGCTGDDTITATLESLNADIRASVDVTIAADTVLAVQFVSNSENNLSIKGAGGIEVSLVKFKLVGALGAPIIGESVSFSVSPSTGGAALAQGTDTGISDVNGEVTTVVQSGTIAGVVRVTATHDATDVVGISSGISISTGIATADRFSLSVSDFAPLDAFDTDGVTVNFSVIVSDQFGNPLPDGTSVSFVSPEAGQIGGSCLLTGGGCGVTWISADDRPADNRVSVIAFMNGAEQFDDTNGNNIFDTGDVGSFRDLGELCVDVDASGGCDPLTGDYFLDSNLNGIVDGADGVWSGPCLSALNDEPILSNINETAICNTPDTVTVSRVATLFLTNSIVTVLDLGTFPASNTVIDLTDDNEEIFSGMIIGDSLGNPLPTGSGISFKFSSSFNTPNFTSPTRIIVDDQAPTGPFGISFSPRTGLDGTTELILDVSVPTSGATEVTSYRWDVIY
jgi:hypothetical protein